MIIIYNTIVSEDVVEKQFVCNLNACKGACCVSGDSGAPLDFDETIKLEQIYDKVKPYMTQRGIEAVEKNGVYYLDSEKEPATNLVNNKECAFVYFDSS